jgi:hypothetical protein
VPAGVSLASSSEFGSALAVDKMSQVTSCLQGAVNRT